MLSAARAANFVGEPSSDRMFSAIDGAKLLAFPERAFSPSVESQPTSVIWTVVPVLEINSMFPNFDDTKAIFSFPPPSVNGQ
jgi:hypothetical protein